MDLQTALDRITFKISTVDDSHAVNSLVSTKNILYELNSQLKLYAMKTKGIQDFYSVPITSNSQFIDAPPLALRTEAYRYAYLITRGWVNPIDIRGQRDITPIFRGLPIRSVGGWIMLLNEINKQRIYFYPMSATSFNSTTLTGNINSSVTTIPVTSAASFIATGGRLTIGTEKILYEYKDMTNFYGCVRGVEGTTAATHSTNDAVNENNLVLTYSRLPTPLTVTDTPTAPQLASELEIVEEHIEGVLDITSYSLFRHIDAERAAAYKADAVAMLEQYKLDIQKGYSKSRPGVNVRNPYLNENGIPLNGNRC